MSPPQTIIHALKIGALLNEMQRLTNIPLPAALDDLHSHLVASQALLDRTSELMCNIVDWPESKREKRIVIRSAVSPELDNLKQLYNGLDGLLNQVAEQEFRLLDPAVRAKIGAGQGGFFVLYAPQQGFHISVAGNAELERDPTISGLEFMVCATEQSVVCEFALCLHGSSAFFCSLVSRLRILSLQEWSYADHGLRDRGHSCPDCRYGSYTTFAVSCTSV